jgi:PH (Pleckstrin Homology) domain-containing protein
VTSAAGAGAGAAEAGDEVLVLRPRRAVVLSVIGAVLMVALFVTVAVVLRNSPTGVYFRLADQVAMVLMGLLLAGGLLLLARPRVRADARGVEVRNIAGSKRFEWALVQRIAFPDGASWARLELPDDEYLPVLAIQAADGARAVEGITRLRALHAAARAR